MYGGAERIDTSYEELRTDIQKRLSTAKSKEEYVSHCKSILEEMARRSDCDKFLGVHETGKTLFYDFTPELINEVKKQIAEQEKGESLQQIGKGTKEAFCSNPQSAITAMETLENGVRTQEEIKEGKTRGEE